MANDLTAATQIDRLPKSDIDLELIYRLPAFVPLNENELTSWLADRGVNLQRAGSKQGIPSLLRKIQEGEASLVYDQETAQVYRLARVVSLDVKVTLGGERYVPFELTKIFLTGEAPTREQVLSGDIASAIADRPIQVRAAQVRNSLAIWETLSPDDKDFEQAAFRALHEELGIPESRIHDATVAMDSPRLEYEEPMDWPGIPSILHRVPGVAVIPEELSKPAYFEYSSDTKQLSVFTVLPDNPFVKNLIELVLPQINYAAPEDTSATVAQLPSVARVLSARSIPERLIRGILQHGAGSSIYVAATGAGGDLLADLPRLGGSSAIYAGGVFPYATEQTSRLLGYQPTKYVSSEVAEGLANEAYLEAQRTFLLKAAGAEVPLPRCIGLGLTAAVASQRERRGADAVFISVRTPDGLWTGKFPLAKGFGDEMRAKHNAAVTEIALNALAQAVGAEQIPLDRSVVVEGLTTDGICALNEVTPSGVQLDSPVMFMADGSTADLQSLDPEQHLIYPGSFRGFHCGHDLVARAAEQATRKRTILEISTHNAQKAGIDSDEVARRLVGVRGRYGVAVVQAPLFREKSLLYPEGMHFALGYDIAAGLVNAKYYGGTSEGVEEAMDLFRSRRNRFWVLGRRGEDKIFRSIDDIPGIDSYRDIFRPLYGALDVSSSQLRKLGS